jgi:hypothetical protein
MDIVNAARENFARIYSKKNVYRATGVVLFNLATNEVR